jgi:hypothetical protein
VLGRCLSVPLTIHADPVPQTIYEFLTKRECTKVSSEEISGLKSCTSGLGLRTTYQNLDELAEALVLSEIGAKESAALKCVKEKTSRLAQDTGALAGSVNDTCKKLEILRDALKNKAFLEKWIRSYESTSDPWMRNVPQDEMERNKVILSELRERLALYSDLERSLRATDELLSSPNVYEFVRQQMSDGIILNGATAASTCASLGKNAKKLLQSDIAVLDESEKSLHKHLNDLDWIHDETFKRSLWATESKDDVLKQFATRGSFKNSTYCRLEGRYGLGAEARDRLVEIGVGALGFGVARIGRIAATAMFGERVNAVQLGARFRLSADVATGAILGLSQVREACGLQMKSSVSSQQCGNGVGYSLKQDHSCLWTASLALFAGGMSALALRNAFKKIGDAVPNQNLFTEVAAHDTRTWGFVTLPTAKSTSTIRANPRMEAALAAKEPLKSWPTRASELAAAAVNAKVEELTKKYPREFLRPTPDLDKLNAIKRRFASDLLEPDVDKVIRVRNLKGHSLKNIEAQLRSALLDREKLTDALLEEGLEYYRRNRRWTPAQLERLKREVDLKLLRSWIDDLIDEEDAVPEKFLDRLKQSSRETVEHHLGEVWENRMEKATALRWPRWKDAEYKRSMLESIAQVERWSKGHVRSSEVAEYEKWRHWGSAQASDYEMQKSYWARDDSWNGGTWDNVIRARKFNPKLSNEQNYAQSLLEEGLLSEEAPYYRELMDGRGPLSQQIANRSGKAGTLPVPNAVRAACSECPAEFLFAKNSHFDEHTWERAELVLGRGKTFFARKNPPEAIIPVLNRLASLPKGASSAAYAWELKRAREVLSGVKNSLSRPDVETTVWSVSKRNKVMEDLDKGEWTLLEGKAAHENHRLFQVDLKGVRVNVAVCVRRPCSGAHLQPGEVASIYPVCGSSIYQVPRVNKVELAIKALSEATLNLNRTVRAGFIAEKLCK